MAATTKTVTLSDMVDLALGTPDSGAVNFNLLNTVLHTMLTKLSMDTAEVEVVDPYEDAEHGDEDDELVDKSGTVSFRQLAARVVELEQLWRELNLIPTNSELFRRVKKLRKTAEEDELAERRASESRGETSSVTSLPSDEINCKMVRTGQPIYDMWQNLQIVKQIETNTNGISKLMSMMESLFAEAELMKAMRDMLVEQLNSNSGTTEHLNNQMTELISFIKLLESRVYDLEMDMSSLPDDDYFDSLPTWTKLELYFRGGSGDLEHGSQSTLGSSSTTSLSENDSQFSTRGKLHRGKKHRSLTDEEKMLEEKYSSHHIMNANASNRRTSENMGQRSSKEPGRTSDGVRTSADATARAIKDAARNSAKTRQSADGQRTSEGVEARKKSSGEDRADDAEDGGSDDADEDEEEEEGEEAPREVVPRREVEAPATNRLKVMMAKLGTIDARHVALVKRVDELELWLRAELLTKASMSSGAFKEIESIVKDFNKIRDEMECIRAIFHKEAGSIVCAQEKLKQLQNDVDCILKACYGDQCSTTPDCRALEIRVSWCVIVDTMSRVKSDVEQIFTRLGGRLSDDEVKRLDPYITMKHVQVALIPLLTELDTKAPYTLVSEISMGIGEVLTHLLGKLLDNDNDWRRVVGYLTDVVDSKMSRADMEAFASSIEVKLRCFARRLTTMQREMQGEPSDPGAATKKARCLSCDKIVRYEREPGEVSSVQVLPPGLPVTKSIKPYLSHDLEQFRQIARSMPSPLRPSADKSPYAVYRKTGGILRKKMGDQRVVPGPACKEKHMTECEKECVDQHDGVTNISCVMPMDMHAMKSAQSPPSGKTTKPQPTSKARPPSAEEPAASDLPSLVDPSPSNPQVSKAPKAAPAADSAASSPCMVKPDLREFVLAQKLAVSAVIAHNPTIDASALADERRNRKWPVRSIGEQVGGSLTKIKDSGNGQRACPTKK